GHHPDLHSFPTRRSSDLGAGAGGDELELVGVGVEHQLQHAELVLDLLETAAGGVGRAVRRSLTAEVGRGAATGPDHELDRSLRIDRKSTRLNSSHVSISY